MSSGLSFSCFQELRFLSVLTYLLIPCLASDARPEPGPTYSQVVNRDDRLGSTDRIMNAIGVEPGMIVGDAGAGTGYFTFKLLERVGRRGEVYANDIDKKLLHQIEVRCERDGVDNVHTVVGEVADPRFPRSDLDAVCLSFALHDFEEPYEWLVNLRKYLKPGAIVATIDYDPAKTGTIAGKEHYSREFVINQFSRAGYELVRIEDYLPRDMFLVFRLDARAIRKH